MRQRRVSCDRERGMEMSCDKGERYEDVTEERGMEMSCERRERYGDVM